MDVFLSIRRKKLTIFIDAKDTTPVLELKKMIEGILKIPPQNQQLYAANNVVMDDCRLLQDYGLTSTTAKAQSPAHVALTIKDINSDEFEPIDCEPYSIPPDLPEVMKGQDSNNQEHHQST